MMFHAAEVLGYTTTIHEFTSRNDRDQWIAEKPKIRVVPTWMDVRREGAVADPILHKTENV